MLLVALVCLAGQTLEFVIEADGSYITWMHQVCAHQSCGSCRLVKAAHLILLGYGCMLQNLVQVNCTQCSKPTLQSQGLRLSALLLGCLCVPVAALLPADVSSHTGYT